MNVRCFLVSVSIFILRQGLSLTKLAGQELLESSCFCLPALGIEAGAGTFGLLPMCWES